MFLKALALVHFCFLSTPVNCLTLLVITYRRYIAYADDTQLYLAFKPNNNATQLAAVRSMEACVEDLRRWMIKDKLMLNDDKTEFVLIGTKQQLVKVCIDTLSVGISEVSNSSLVRNLGSWFDCNFTMATHVNKICKAAFYHPTLILLESGNI